MYKLICTLWALVTTLSVQAQDARSLVKEGVELNNAHNYAGAIEKYKAALQLEPDNASANYQMAFALQASGKGNDALPYLQKVVQSGASTAVISSAYGLMGGIYDKAGQPQKAIDSYRQGLKADTGSYALQYGLGLAYFRNRQYAEAEQSAVQAISIDPQQAGCMRFYALMAFHQNKRAAALLGFCSFLALDPSGPQSAEAYGNIQHILQGGTLKPEPGAAPSHPDAATNAFNTAITQAVAAAAKRKYPTAADQLSEQLQAIFTGVGQLAEKQNGVHTFFKQQAAYYYQMAQAGQLPAFARLISQSADKNAGVWLKAHPQQVAALQEWMKAHRVEEQLTVK